MNRSTFPLVCARNKGAYASNEAVVLGELPEPGIESVLTAAIGFPADDHRLDDVIEHRLRYPADRIEEVKGLLDPTTAQQAEA